MPAVGMESEFNVWVDGSEVVPEKFWKAPTDFITIPLLPREGRSLQLPTGGAVYFDRGVIEVVTPLIEVAPKCTARMVRSLWEQIAFVRDQLTEWEKKTGHEVRLRGYSSHYNVSFEIPRSQQSSSRNERKLSLLLAYIFPPILMMLGANRRSTGVGVRPRGGRIEITLDFTPDPVMMIVTAAAVIGIVREIMTWDSYELDVLEELPIPLIANVIPGKHTTRKGWLTKDFHYPRNPFTTAVDERVWVCTDGKKRSLRRIGLETARYFRKSILRHSDPFSSRLLFAVLERKSRSLLELTDRPLAYDHVGVLCRWGLLLSERILAMSSFPGRVVARDSGSNKTDWIVSKALDVRHGIENETDAARKAQTEDPPRRPRRAPAATAEPDSKAPADDIPLPAPPPPRTHQRPAKKAAKTARRPPARAAAGRKVKVKYRERFYPDTKLSRSIYEQVFLALTSGKKLHIGGKLYTPVAMDGWYHAKLRRQDGAEEVMTIDQLVSELGLS